MSRRGLRDLWRPRCAAQSFELNDLTVGRRRGLLLRVEVGGFLRAERSEGAAEPHAEPRIALDLDGLICKRQSSPYRATEKPLRYWIKVKNCRYSQLEGREELLERAFLSS